jgi:hypothetical protein
VRAAPKQKMAARLGGSHHGGDGDDSGQKRAGEGRGGSVAGMDETRFACPWAEESEGGRKEKEGATRRSALLKWRRRGRGGGPGVVAEWKAGTGKRGGPGCGVGQCGSAATASSGSVTARGGGAAWPRRAAGQTGEGRRD